jgi:hypothetical protein
MRERIEMEYEDPANSVGYETAEGGYQLPTTDTWDLLDELGLGYDLSAQNLHADLTNALGMCDWVHRDPYSLTEEQARRMGWQEFSDLVKPCSVSDVSAQEETNRRGGRDRPRPDRDVGGDVSGRGDEAQG